mmetsp:Transcript_12473/g.13832  ORF Transcript_12473/g.13832 Transcript_12473/m.13832 type:complete len:150 (+) Transcript_12473:187-636(+)
MTKSKSVGELKACLKELGMSQSGDKGTLEYRLERGTQSATLDLQTPDGLPVHQLKLAKLKPFAARAGISPIGNLDEIMFAYMEYLIPLQQQQKGGVETVEDEDGDDGEAKASSTGSTIQCRDVIAPEFDVHDVKIHGRKQQSKGIRLFL